MTRVAINERVTVRAAAALLSLALVLGAAVMPDAARANEAAIAPGVIVKVQQASGLASTYFELTAHPGKPVRAGSLQLVNPSGHAVRIRLQSVDSLTTDTLGSAYALTASAHGSTPWIRLGSHHVTIAPHAAVSVAVTVNVPRSARPGDYLSGVAVETVGVEATTQTAGGVSIGEIDRYAIGVEVKLPGPRHPSIRFTGARVVRYPSELAFLLLARNGGNVILKNVHGLARVSRDGHVVATAVLGPGTFVTGTVIAYPVGAPGQEATEGSRYRVQAALHYGRRVAYLDTTVTFGHAAAVTQGRYALRAASPGGGGVSALMWVMLALLLALMAVVATVLAIAYRRRQPLRGRAARAYLDRALASASETAPVSIVRVAVNPVAGAGRRARGVVRQRLRAADRVCDLGSQGLFVVLLATDEPMARGLAHDLASALSREGVLVMGDALPVATTTEPTDVVELVATVVPPAARTPA